MKLFEFRIKLAALAIAGVVSGSSASAQTQLQSEAATAENFTYEECNATPYPVQTYIFEAVGRAEFQQSTSFELDAGKCQSFAIMASPNARAFSISVASNSIQFSKLSSDPEILEGWQGRPSWGRVLQGQSNFCEWLFEQTDDYSNLYEACAQEPFLHPVPIRSDDGTARPIESVVQHIQDPILCSRSKGIDCLNSSPVEVLAWAKGLSGSIVAAYRTRFPNVEYGNVVRPYGAGFDTRDSNGFARVGVEVTTAITTTPLGSPVGVQRGDVIVSFNGQPVYERDALSWYILRHGFDYGFETPFVVRVLRAGEYYDIDGYLFFHAYTFKPIFLNHDGACRYRIAATLLAAMQEASFYTQNDILCLTKDSQRYSSHKECVFERKQFGAALQQYCGGERIVGTFLGGFYVPGRGVIELGLARVTGLTGRSIASRAVRAALFEGAEEAIRTGLTVPPGYGPDDTYEEILSGFKRGAVLGTIFQLALPANLTGRRL